MWIEIRNLYSKLIRATDEERAWLSDLLSYDERRFLGGSYSQHTVRLFNVISETFPTGFLPEVFRLARRKGYEVETVDRRVVPCAADPAADLAWLRPYQLEAVRAVERRRRGVIKVATAGGKSHIAIGIGKLFPVPWLFLAHRIQLADQQAGLWEDWAGLPAGRIGEGRWDVPPDARFVCATFQTLYRGFVEGDPRVLALLDATQGVIGDECHVVSAETFAKVFYALRNAYWRVGLSATPFDRTDRRTKVAIGALGETIYELAADPLIQAGVLARPIIRMIEVQQTSTRPTYRGAYGDLIVRSALRNGVLVQCCQRAQKPALLFVKELNHGRELVRRLGRAGLNADFVWGNHSLQWRKDAIKRLLIGQLDVLVCSVIFQEGIDIPELRSLIVGSGGRSIIAALQRVGRGMRRSAGKDSFEVWDIMDQGHENLAEHSRRRLNSYVREKYQVVVEPTGALPLTGVA